MVPGDRRHSSATTTKGPGISEGESRGMERPEIPGNPTESPRVKMSGNEEVNATPGEALRWIILF